MVLNSTVFSYLAYGAHDKQGSNLRSPFVCFVSLVSPISSQEGTAMLLEHLAGSLASAIPVSTQLDIAAQHHLFMMGRNGSNIKHIMQRTGAQIHFPDPSNPQKKSTVYLQGTIESVCLARQYLMVNSSSETCVKKLPDHKKSVCSACIYKSHVN